MTTPDTLEQVGWPLNTGVPASPSGFRGFAIEPLSRLAASRFNP